MEGLGPRAREALCTDNEAREAASFGIVQMKVFNSRITEKSLDLRNDCVSLTYSGIHDHVHRIVRSKGHEALADVLRYFIRFHDTLLCTPAHKDGTGRLVRRVRRLMRVGQQEQFFADLCVNETDTTWIARFLCCYHPLGVKPGKLCVRKPEQRLERFRGKADKLEGGHDAWIRALKPA